MSYFSKFPDILYPFVINGKKTLISIKDIALNVRIRTAVLSNVSFYDTYDILDGETPEKISEKLYGDPSYHWVIMLANNRYDMYSDFPLSSSALEEYVEKKYGEDNVNAPHTLWGEYHFEDENGNIVDGPATALVKLITNYDFEFAENEKKRRIKVLSPSIISRLVSELESAFESYVE
jgi:hypothetical protein